MAASVLPVPQFCIIELPLTIAVVEEPETRRHRFAAPTFCKVVPVITLFEPPDKETKSAAKLAPSMVQPDIRRDPVKVEAIEMAGVAAVVVMVVLVSVMDAAFVPVCTTAAPVEPPVIVAPITVTVAPIVILIALPPPVASNIVPAFKLMVDATVAKLIVFCVPGRLIVVVSIVNVPAPVTETTFILKLAPSNIHPLTVVVPPVTNKQN